MFLPFFLLVSGWENDAQSISTVKSIPYFASKNVDGVVWKPKFILYGGIVLAAILRVLLQIVAPTDVLLYSRHKKELW